MSTVLRDEVNAALYDDGDVGVHQLLLAQCVSRTPSIPLDRCRPALEVQLPLALDVQRPEGDVLLVRHPSSHTHTHKTQACSCSPAPLHQNQNLILRLDRCTHTHIRKKT